jgi:hypothetical protein
MTTLQIKLKAHNVELLLSMLIKQTEIPIDEIIVVDGTGKIANGQKQLKKRNLMRIAQAYQPWITIPPTKFWSTTKVTAAYGAFNPN